MQLLSGVVLGAISTGKGCDQILEEIRRLQSLGVVWIDPNPSKEVVKQTKSPPKHHLPKSFSPFLSVCE